MKLSTSIAVASLVGASLTPVASADVLVSNLGGGSDFIASSAGSTIQNNFVYAAQFVTGANLSEVLGATARLQNVDGHGIATYEGLIYSNDAGLPGSVVATFDSMPTLAEGAGLANVSFASTMSITLDPNTVYWFGVRNTSGTYLSWETTHSNSQASTAGWTIDNEASARSRDAGVSWDDRSVANGGNVMKFSIEGNTVPTPGALALLGAGGIIASRRRRG